MSRSAIQHPQNKKTPTTTHNTNILIATHARTDTAHPPAASECKHCIRTRETCFNMNDLHTILHPNVSAINPSVRLLHPRRSLTLQRCKDGLRRAQCRWQH